MSDRIMLFFSLQLSVLIVSTISFAQTSWPLPKVWNITERAGLRNGGNFSNVSERLISVPLDPANLGAGNFDLHYFVKTPMNGRASKTVLFCVGGPGELARPSESNKTIVDFFQSVGYDVVYFDLRGSGFSQIPSPNSFDQFLTTANAVEDIESIRRDFLGEKRWDAIIGYSYGTVLAQQYTHKYPKRVGKLVLVAPLSMHQFASSGTAYEEYFQDVQRIRGEVLDKLYGRLEVFKSIERGTRIAILNQLFGNSTDPGVFKRIEDAFGSEQFVIDAYCALRESNLLSKYGVGNYSRRFFEKLRELRKIGWQMPIGTGVRESQVEMMKVITLGLQPRLTKELGELEPESDCPEFDGQESHRVYYVMGAYDGLNRRFLREWFAAGKLGNLSALRSSGGLAHLEMAINKPLEKVGIEDNHLIKPWDPANYPHDRPTLILKGGADPVTAWGQAERYYSHGLNGPRTLIEFEGVGHDFYLPGDGGAPASDGTIILDPPTIPAGKTTWVTGSVSNIGKRTIEENVRNLSLPAIRFESENRALIKVINGSPNAVLLPQSEFRVEDAMFKGLVKIDAQEIPGGNLGTWIWGKIAVSGANLKFTVAPPRNLESGLEFMGKIETDSWNKVYVEIRNNNPFPVDGESRSWIFQPVQLSANTSCLTGIIGSEIRSRDCILYAFVEAEYADFHRLQSRLLAGLPDFITRPPKSCWEKGCDP